MRWLIACSLDRSILVLCINASLLRPNCLINTRELVVDNLHVISDKGVILISLPCDLTIGEHNATIFVLHDCFRWSRPHIPFTQCLSLRSHLPSFFYLETTSVLGPAIMLRHFAPTVYAFDRAFPASRSIGFTTHVVRLLARLSGFFDCSECVFSHLLPLEFLVSFNDILAVKSGLGHFFTQLRWVITLLTPPWAFFDFIFKRYVGVSMHTIALLWLFPGCCVLEQYVIALMVIAHIQTALMTALMQTI